MHDHKLKSLLAVAAGALALAAPATAADAITRQNGSTPALDSFTSICAVHGYIDYGECAGDPTKFTTVTGRIDAIQQKAGVYSLGFRFGGLRAGESYTLWGRFASSPFFFAIATKTARDSGELVFDYKVALADADAIGFDLNHARWMTNVTTWWSGQLLSPDGANGPLVRYTG